MSDGIEGFMDGICGSDTRWHCGEQINNTFDQKKKRYDAALKRKIGFQPN
jgi:hypothetical protein